MTRAITSVLVVLALVASLGVRPAVAQGVFGLTYTIIIAIDADDKKPGQLNALNGLVQGMLARLSGRDQDPNDLSWFDRYVLADTQPEIGVRILVGYEAGTDPDMLDLIASLPAAITVRASCKPSGQPSARPNSSALKLVPSTSLGRWLVTPAKSANVGRKS